nr:gamma-glutamylcyclotransferase family protein [Anoxybacillus sp. EFIL]
MLGGENVTLFQVFVYGTLLQGEQNHHVVAPYVTHIETGAVCGWLHSVADLYPALVLDSSAPPVEGEWLTVNEKGLQAMDRLEGYYGEGKRNDYERVFVTDVDGKKAGFVYVYSSERAKHLPQIGTSWRAYKQSYERGFK